MDVKPGLRILRETFGPKREWNSMNETLLRGYKLDNVACMGEIIN
jgi:hypothetical protein